MTTVIEEKLRRIELWMLAVEAYLGFDPLAVADIELNAAQRFDEAQAIHHVGEQ